MPYLVEHHHQTYINDVRHLLSAGLGFQQTFSYLGDTRQVLKVSFSGQDELALEWTNRGMVCNQVIKLSKTKTNFQGSRLWYVCPNCSRRCGSLFDFGNVWACRQCGELKYSSASGSKYLRPYLKMNKILSKVRYSELMTIFESLDDSNRPKWMRAKRWEIMKKSFGDMNQQIGNLF